VIRQDEPSLGEEDESEVSSVQYPKADLEDRGGGEESVDEQREGEGSR
jgi:hypothetical protein